MTDGSPTVFKKKYSVDFQLEMDLFYKIKGQDMPFELRIQVWKIMSFRWRPSSWMQFSILRLKSSITWANSCWLIVSTSCQMASFNSFKLRGSWMYTQPFRYPQMKKSHDDKSGDLGGHGTSPKRGFKRRIENCIQEDGLHLNGIIFHTWIPNSNGMSWLLIL